MKIINIIIAILIVSILGSIGYLYNATHTIEQNLHNNLNKMFTDHVGSVSSRIATFLQKYIKDDPYIQLKNDPKLQSFLQDALSLTAVSPHRYVYVLYRDEQGRYRYLLDGSQEDRGEFNQKLDVDTTKWDQVYNNKKPQLFLHKDSSILYITYLYPLMIQNSVKGIIAIDFTSELPQTIAEILAPAKKIIDYLFFLLFLLFIALLYQLHLYLTTRKKAITDTLTQTYNRSYLKTFIEQIDPAKYAILMLDIDHFKKINDTYGHKAGDFILQEVTSTIRQTLRKEDHIFRYGGEEFIIFIKKEGKDDNIIKIAERLRSTLEKTPYHYQGHNIKITASIGIVAYPEKYRSIKEAIKQADEYLYEAKRLGRNQICYNTDIIKKPHPVTSEIHTIKDAIENGRLFLEYQPIFDIHTQKIIRFEALVRLKDEEGKVIYPGAFLEQIAFTTIYNTLTKEVLRQVFAAIKKYNVKISINLNFSDITDNVIFEIIRQELEHHRNLAEYLVIELLENEAFSQFNNLQEKLQILKSYSVKIAIDDFGSGYSNFEIFRYLPVDVLKIDGTLIKELPASKITYNMVKSIALFAKSIGIKVVAEYVENEKTLKLLKRLHIQYAQGFHLGKPKPLEAYLQNSL